MMEEANGREESKIDGDDVLIRENLWQGRCGPRI